MKIPTLFRYHYLLTVKIQIQPHCNYIYTLFDSRALRTLTPLHFARFKNFKVKTRCSEIIQHFYNFEDYYFRYSCVFIASKRLQ